jgi:uncharacterized protein YjbI with pentapeptide repeats
MLRRKRDLWKVGSVLAGSLLFLLLTIWLSVSAAHAQLATFRSSTRGVVTVQETPTVDPTTTTLQKEQLAQQVADGQHTFANLLWNNAVALVSIVVVVVGGLIGYLRWLAEQRNAFLLTRQTAETERHITVDNQRSALLQTYIDKMSELLLGEKLRESEGSDELHKIARVRTLTVLAQLDGKRKGSVLQFLYEAGLINNDNKVIDLTGADLTGADLSNARLVKVDLSGTNLSSANLNYANLREASLQGANLREAFLHKAILEEANLNKADLTWAISDEAYFGRADLRGADLHGAHLSNAYLTDADLSSASLDRADLRSSFLNQANLTKVSLKDADLSGARLFLANLTDTELIVAKSIQGANLQLAEGLSKEQKRSYEEQGAFVNVPPSANPIQPPTSSSSNAQAKDATDQPAQVTTLSPIKDERSASVTQQDNNLQVTAEPQTKADTSSSGSGKDNEASSQQDAKP